MLFAYDVVADRQETIPGVVHIDGTSRVQTVSQSSNAKYHKLISEFEQLTGVPIVLNTSFNDSEPIVCSPQDAVTTFLKTKIDCLAIGSFLVCK
jgi:carbamoyltransferase